MSDPLDRLKDAFDEVPVPDQWDAIVARSKEPPAAGGRASRSHRSMWWLGAAAVAVAALVGGIVVIVNRDTSAPLTAPGETVPAPDPVMPCRSEADLAAITALIESGIRPFEQEPAPDFAELMSRKPHALLVGTVSAAVRSGDFTRLELADGSKYLHGEGPVDAVSLRSQWSDATRADPLAERVQLDGVMVVAFVRSLSSSPVWVPDPEGLYFGCAGTQVPAIGVPWAVPSFLGGSIEDIATQVTTALGVGATPTVPDSTPPPPTTPAATVPITPGPGGPCTEQIGPASEPEQDPAEWGSFGPLGAQPGLDIRLPDQVVSEQSWPGTASVHRIDGGVLVTARSNSAGEYVSTVALVGHDGSVGWRRCLAGYVNVLVGDGADRALLQVIGPDEDIAVGHWETIVLATGQSGEPPAELAGRGWPAVHTSRHALFAVAGGAVTDDTASVVVVDLSTLDAAQLPYPPSAIGQEGSVDIETFEVAGEAVVALMLDGMPIEFYADGAPYDPTPNMPLSQALDEHLRASRAATFWHSSDLSLDGLNGWGEIVWQRPDLLDIGHEGFHVSDLVGDEETGVFLVNACFAQDSETTVCQEYSLQAVAAADGHTVWSYHGTRAVKLVSGNYAIVETAGDGPLTYEMVDVRTGARVTGTGTWSEQDFYTECCGGSDYFWVGSDGALAWTAATQWDGSDSHIMVWYPAGATGSTVTVDLLGGSAGE